MNGVRSVWLWSRRPRVRVPSLTPQEVAANGWFCGQVVVGAAGSRGPDGVQFFLAFSYFGSD
jgi:hypothetical protein